MFYAALSFPLPLVLAVAFCAGFIWDALSFAVIDGEVKNLFGSTVLQYGLIVASVHLLVQPMSRKDWALHCMLCGAGVFFILFSDYIYASYINLGEGRKFVFPQIFWLKVAWSAIVGNDRRTSCLLFLQLPS